MKRAYTALIALVVTIAFAPTLLAQGVEFFEGNWSEALAEAKASGKYVYLDAYTQWCGPCKGMDKETFPNEDVGAFFREHFIPVKRDMEKGEGVVLAMKYRVSSYPSHLVFNSDGAMVYRTGGGMGPERFITIMEPSLDPESQLSLEGVSNSLDLDYPEFYRNALSRTGRVSDSVVTEYLSSHDDWFDEVNWSIVYYFGRGAKVQRFIEENRERLSALFGKDEVDQKVRRTIEMKFNRSIKEKDEVARDAALERLKEEFPEYYKWVEWSYRYRYCEQTEDWSCVVEMLQARLETSKQKPSNNTLNNASWALYQGCDDEEILVWAVEVMKNVIVDEPVWAYIDTYAALLFKTDRYEEAEVQALHAIETGKAAGEDTQASEKLLARIRAKL